MFDLVISYDNENGKHTIQKYNTIMDFIDTMESDSIDAPVVACNDVSARFFENPLRTKHFCTIRDLYNHCKEIIK